MSNPVLKFKPLPNVLELGREPSPDPWRMGGTLVVIQDSLQRDRVALAMQDGDADHAVRRDEIRCTIVGWAQIEMLRDALSAALASKGSK